MKKPFQLSLLIFTSSALCAQSTSDFPEILSAAIGDKMHVFEIVGGEAQVGQAFLKRIDVGKDSVALTVRNESQKAIAPQIAARFYNRYGMQICLIEAQFADDAVPPGGVRVKQFGLTAPEIEGIFRNSSIKLPSDWRNLRFVKIDDLSIAAPKLGRNPLPGLGKKQGDNPDSFGSNVVRLPTNPKPIPEKIEGAKDVPLVEGATANQVANDPEHPRSRPQVVKQQNTRPAIFAENKFGTSNIGNIVVDAKWSNYGAYLQRMIDTVQMQWERILIEQKVYPASGSTVTVKFIMDSEGKIARIVNVDRTASDSASRACISGITDRAPYGPWTDDMIAMLGKQQEMTFTFYYQ